jgi:hypothetical protein
MLDERKHPPQKGRAGGGISILVLAKLHRGHPDLFKLGIQLPLLDLAAIHLDEFGVRWLFDEGHLV